MASRILLKITLSGSILGNNSYNSMMKYHTISIGLTIATSYYHFFSPQQTKGENSHHET